MKTFSQIALLVVTLSYTSAADAASITILAKTGDAAPDGNGTFSSFARPGLNDFGEAVFLADLIGGPPGIFRSSGGTLTQINRNDSVAPDGNGTFAGFGSPGLNNLGQSGFFGILTGTNGGSLDNEGIFRGDGDTLTQIAREGVAAPDGNGTLEDFRIPFLNNLGQAVFEATLTGTSGGNTDNEGIFRGDGSTLIQVARKGAAAPDGNGVFSDIDFSVLNDSSQTAFIAILDGTSGGTSDDSGIFRGNSNGTITQIAREGNATPDGNGTFGEIIGQATLNNSSEIAFYAFLNGTSGGTSDDRGIFRGNSNGTITQIVREGDAAPDGNGTFINFNSNNTLNDSGQVAFKGSLTGASRGTAAGVFRSDGETITQIAREGSATPDGNGVFSYTFFRPVINDSGQTAFLANLEGTSGDTSDDVGIFLGDGIDLVQVVREGDAFAGSTITEIRLMSSPATGDGLNNFGQVAFYAILANGTSAIGLYTPELRFYAPAGDSEWSNDFTPGMAPGAVHDITLETTKDAVIAGPTVDTTLASLVIGGGTGNTQLNLQNGVNLTATNGLTLTTGGILGGTGMFTGDVTVGDGGTIAPGNSPGTQTHVGNETWTDGGIFELEVNDFLGTVGADPGWDLLDISGTLDITAAPGDPFVIDVNSLAGLIAGDAANFHSTQNFNLTFVQTGSGITGFSEDAFLLDLSGFTNVFTGTFAIEQQGDNLALTYTGDTAGVPEPSTYAMFAVGLFGIGILVRRRRRTSK